MSKLDVFLSKLSAGYYCLLKYSKEVGTYRAPRGRFWGTGPSFQKCGWNFINKMTLSLLLFSDPPLDSAFILYPWSASRKSCLEILLLVPRTQMGVDFLHLFLSWAGGDMASAGMEGNIGAGGLCGKWRDLRKKAGLESQGCL